jgi:hypothetical protein
VGSSDYEEKEALLATVRERVAYLFSLSPNAGEKYNNNAVECWLELESDSYWGMSPIEAIRAGHGKEVLAVLNAKISVLSKTKAPA